MWQKIKDKYTKLFALNEIEKDPVLQAFAGAIILGFIFTFQYWNYSSATATQAVLSGEYVCWPWWQTCDDAIFLEMRPFGYSQAIVYMFLLFLLFTAAIALYRKNSLVLHFSILILFIWKLYAVSVNYYFGGNYDFFHTVFCLSFLFCHHKKFFAQLLLILLYFLTVMVKIHEAWIVGTYFTALESGLPIFGHWLTPLWSNLVVFMEMIGIWFLFSKNRILQASVFIFFVIFHFYSSLLVGFRYPLIVLPVLIILFNPFSFKFLKPHQTPLDKKSVIGWFFVILLFVFQSISHFIPGDEKLTMEGNFYGLFMFESNHQCIVKATQHNEIIFEQNSANARERCDPYEFWFKLKNKHCKKGAVDLKIAHSINGGPFYETVNEVDVCQLSYKPFHHNQWIKSPPEAPVIAYPVQNTYQ